jgi:predicted kinase
VRAILIAGPPAAGKTTVGRGVARQLGAALLDLDTVTGPLVEVVAGLVGTADLDAAALAGATRTARYATLLAVAQDCLRSGTPVVLVAPFTAERSDPAAWREWVAALRAAGGEPLLLWLRLGAVEAAARMRDRGAARDREKAGGARADVRQPVVPHVAVDAAAPPAAVLAAVLAALGTRG